MAQEREYRDLLRQAQESVEPIRSFLGAVSAKIPNADPRLLQLVEAAEHHARTLEHELDEIWDLLKRDL